MRRLFVLVAVLAVTAAELVNTEDTSNISAGHVHSVARQRRSMWPFASDPNEYSCQIAPYVTFYPGDNSEQMPVYLCTNGPIEVLIGTRDFYLGRSRHEYATYATLKISPDLLHIEYPGAFAATPSNLAYTHAVGIPRSNTVEITGLLFLTEGGSKRKSNFFQFLSPNLYNCQFIPSAAFYNADIADAPVYRCIRGLTEILIASESFRDPNDPQRVSREVELNIGDEVLEVNYPGYFHQKDRSIFRGNSELTHNGESFYVRGLLRLADY